MKKKLNCTDRNEITDSLLPSSLPNFVDMHMVFVEKTNSSNRQILNHNRIRFVGIKHAWSYKCLEMNKKALYLTQMQSNDWKKKIIDWAKL